MTEFKDKLKELRAANGWTQREAADRMGIKIGALASYEEGRAQPNHNTLHKIVTVYAVPREDLYDLLFPNPIPKQ